MGVKSNHRRKARGRVPRQRFRLRPTRIHVPKPKRKAKHKGKDTEHEFGPVAFA